MTLGIPIRRWRRGTAWIYLCALPLVALAPRVAGGEQEPVRDFAIVYRVDPSEEMGEGEVRVWFAAPDRWRIETRTKERDDTVAAAGDRVVVEDRKAKGFLLMAREEASHRLEYGQSVGVDLTKRYADWAGYVAARDKEVSECQQEQGEAKVLGRACQRYESSFSLGETPLSAGAGEEHMEFVTCVDRELHMPLEDVTRFGGKLAERMVATSVRVNSGAEETRFNLIIPPGARLFKGGLSRVPRADFTSPGTTVAEAMLGLARMGQALAMYVPEYVPEGFANAGAASESEGKWFTTELASESGATLVIGQSRDRELMPLSPLPGARPVDIGESKGEIVESREPYDRMALTWQAGEWRMRLDAGGVSSGEVMKVAESMRWQTAKPPLEFEDPKEAQGKVHFLILIPKALPKGARLVGLEVMPYKKGRGDSYTPEQVSLDYITTSGYVSISEIRGYEGTKVEGWERVKIGGQTGWYHQDPEIGRQLNWVHEGTEVSLSGDLSKEEMLKIARSFEPADPSARPRVQRYQREHSLESEFGL